MPAVHVRDLPEEAVSALKRRAERNQRSLQKELLRILLEAAEEAPSEEPPPPIRLKLARRSRGSARWRRAEIYGDDGR